MASCPKELRAQLVERVSEPLWALSIAQAAARYYALPAAAGTRRDDERHAGASRGFAASAEGKTEYQTFLEKEGMAKEYTPAFETKVPQPIMGMAALGMLAGLTVRPLAPRWSSLNTPGVAWEWVPVHRAVLLRAGALGWRAVPHLRGRTLTGAFWVLEAGWRVPDPR